MPTIDQLKERTSYYADLAFYEHAPTSARVLMLIAVLYLLSPIDLIPDFIPIIGFLDDLIIVPMLFSMAFKQIEAVKAAYQEAEKRNQAQGVIEPEFCRHDE